MWSVVLKILSILGIILLILLGILLAVVLLVLFMPIVYWASGSAHAGEYRFGFRFRWLFGLVRGEFIYPEGRALRIKALWLTLYDSGAKRRDVRDFGDATESGKEPAGKTKAAGSTQNSNENVEMTESIQDSDRNVESAESPTNSVENVDTAGSSQDSTKREEKTDAPKPSQEKPQGQEKKPEESASREPLFAKLSGLKEKLQPYLAIVRDENNQALVGQALGRLGRILKCIRPRVLRLEALIGTGEPDTTGYVYGAVWAVKPFLGRKCRIAITPDFEMQILEGEVFLRGHVMAVVLIYHAVRVILDKRLWQLMDQLKKI